MKVFLSYTRRKDQFSAVSDFAKHFATELAMRAPECTLFHDMSSIQEGQHFPELLEAEVASSRVFVPLLSPAWYASDWCRREFEIFTSRGTNDERLRSILPVLWVKTPQPAGSTNDNAALILANIHHFDWTDLRYGDWNSAENRKQVGKLADRAVALLQQEIESFESAPELAGAFKTQTERHTTAKERVYDGLKDPKHGWRTIERLAILGGITEDEVLELLVQDPNVKLGQRKKDGKRMAQLKRR
jgi:hypothetical protein